MEHDFIELIDSDIKFFAPPYTWKVSVPGFGQMIEESAKNLFQLNSMPDCLGALDEIAFDKPVDTAGMILELPYWNSLGQTVGKYAFHARNVSPKEEHAVKARLILESLAYMLLCNFERESLRANSIYVSGGGSRSAKWCSILSEILQRPMRISAFSSGADSSALLGMYASNPGKSVGLLSAKAKLITSKLADDAVDSYKTTLDKAISVYGSNKSQLRI